MSTLDLELTPVYFAEEILGITLYPWQDKVLSCFERSPMERVKVSLCTPNGAGKSERIVATLVLYWLAMFPKGKVIVTTKSGLQLDTQVCPAVERHQSKFPGWHFIERHVGTPTGGQGIFFVTDSEQRAEGHHPAGDIADGPVLLIVDEAKSVPEEIFQALDRCTFQAMLYVSSTGGCTGRFYESQMTPEKGGFKSFRVGLSECPHIPKERIDDIISTYGIDHPITRSTLFAEWMVASGESKFDAESLKFLTDTAAAWTTERRRRMAEHPEYSPWGRIPLNNNVAGPFLPGTETDSWVWCAEAPIPGCAYVGFGDTATGRQSEGSAHRDCAAYGVIREAYIDVEGVLHKRKLAAVLHHHSGVRWDNDIVADRFNTLLLWYGDPICNLEANNAGVEVIGILFDKGRTIWRREKADAAHKGKKLDVLGFLTTGTSKHLWVGQVASHVRDRTLECEYEPAVRDFSTFILTEDGKGGAQAGAFDDWVTGIGLGLFIMPSATVYRPPFTIQQRVIVNGAPVTSWTGPREKVHGGAMS